MTSGEREMIAGMVALFGLFLEKYKPMIDESMPKLRYAADKLERTFEMFFAHYRYERSPEEVRRIREFVSRSQLFLLAPEDANCPEVQVLLEKQKAWLHQGAEEMSRDHALTEGWRRLRGED